MSETASPFRLFCQSKRDNCQDEAMVKQVDGSKSTWIYRRLGISTTLLYFLFGNVPTIAWITAPPTTARATAAGNGCRRLRIVLTRGAAKIVMRNPAWSQSQPSGYVFF
jgi:hypothetical protein